MQFSHLRSSVLPGETRRFLLWTHPPPSVLHIPNLSKVASSVPEICDFKIGFVSSCFFSSYFSFSFSTLTKTAIKLNSISDFLDIWQTEGGYKSTSWYQLWLEYDKQAKSY